MRTPKSRFWSLLFALIPGCGQMYLGFMKRGLSLMIYCAIPVLLSAMGNLDILFLGAVIVWAYSFFDALNLRALDPETLAAIPDELLVPGNLPQLQFKSDKIYKTAGILLILVGAYSIWNMIFWTLYNDLYDYEPYLAHIIYAVNNLVPRLLISVAIIWLGIRLTRSKKQETALLEEPTDEFNQKA